MRTSIWSIMFFASIACLAMTMIAQNVTQDVVYLKNGKTIRGDIIELIPDKTIKIRTADGSLFVFAMSEVDRIQKEETSTPTPTRANPARSSDSTEIVAGFFVGGAFPTGDFADTRSNLGGAKIGFTAGFQVQSRKNIGLLVNIAYTRNESKIASAWNSLSALAGMKIRVVKTKRTELHFSPLLGFVYVSTPYFGASSSSFAWAYGGMIGIELEEILGFGVRITGSNPEFKFRGLGSTDLSVSMALIFAAIHI